MNKITTLLSFIFFGMILIGQASATCSIQPDTWDIGDISPDSTVEKTFTIDATGSSCQISTDSDYITFSKTTFENTTSSFRAVLIIPENAEHQSYTQNIKVNDAPAVTVTYTVSSPHAGRLEPTFSWTKKQFEQGVEATQIINLRNRYDTEIEITHIGLEGDIVTTKEGITKPVYIKEGKAGFLQSGEDTSITIGFNTIDVKPGDYSVKLLVTYYVEDERKTLEISLEVTVLKSFETEKQEVEIKNMEMSINPEKPKEGDYVAVMLKDSETKESVVGDIWVYVYTDSTLKTSFKYFSPFEVETGYRYLINATAKGYNPAQITFLVGLEEAKITHTPKQPVKGDTVKFYYVDSSENIISDAKIKVNDEECDNPCVIEDIDEGSYKITAEKSGYRAVQTSIIVRKPLRVIEMPKSAVVGQEVVVKFEESEDYSVMKGSEMKFSGFGKNITFTPDEEGNYTIFARDKEVGTIEVYQGIDVTKGVYFVIAVIAVVILIVFLLKKRKKKMKTISLGKYHAGALRTESEGE